MAVNSLQYICIWVAVCRNAVICRPHTHSQIVGEIMEIFKNAEPLECYTGTLRAQVEKNAADYFDELVKRSGVNVAENAATVKKYNAAAAKAEEAGRKLSSVKSTRTFLLIIGIMCLIAALVQLIIYFAAGMSLGLLIGGLCCLAVGVVIMIIIFTVIKKQQARRQQHYDKAVAVAEKLKGEGYAQVAPLNALFTWGATRELIKKTIPELVLEQNLSLDRLELLMNKYGYQPCSSDPESSTIFLLSGTVGGNPFLFERRLRHRIVPHIYTGTLTIHWTTYSRDSHGNMRTHHHSQVLQATIEKPAPEYTYQTRLYYGNEAAPDLHFTRTAKYSHMHDEDELEKMVKKGGKKLAAKTRRAAAQGGNFTELANTEFEVLFGATDRDNEVEYRLMFTPLAQTNMVDLLTSDDGYGDDFDFIKNGMLNCIISAHSQSWQPDSDPARYRSYDVAAARNAFITYNSEYFKSMYFDLAPLLSIPLYRMEKPDEYIYGGNYVSNYALGEAEVLANKLGDMQFAPQGAKTQSLLKASLSHRDGSADRIVVAAYAYDTVNMVDYVPVFGGDGNMHSVPVPWIQYNPISCASEMEVCTAGCSRDGFEELSARSDYASFVRRFSASGASAYADGLVAFPVNQGNFGSADGEELARICGVRASAARFTAAAATIAAVEEAANMADEADRKAAKSASEEAQKDAAATHSAADEAAAGSAEDKSGEDTSK